MSTELTPDDVRKVARLARLKLSDEEVATYTRQLGQVLHYIDMLEELDTTGIEPMAHAIELHNVLRADELEPSLPPEAALANAPQANASYFLVPSILDHG
ncbi:MAG: Asp-tRNA(Asn)/Glu-tRNA(Gln) amidotransferase subunit GatC [Planctomycetaceae bacterium]